MNGNDKFTFMGGHMDIPAIVYLPYSIENKNEILLRLRQEMPIIPYIILNFRGIAVSNRLRKIRMRGKKNEKKPQVASVHANIKSKWFRSSQRLRKD